MIQDLKYMQYLQFSLIRGHKVKKHEACKSFKNTMGEERLLSPVHVSSVLIRQRDKNDNQ